MAVEAPRTYADVNAVVGGYLRDLAFAQSSQQKMFGYKRAANAILSLDQPLTDLLGPDGALPRIPGIGPGSTRVIREILETGASPTVEQAVEHSERRADIERRRKLRRHFLSRAEVRRVLADPGFEGPTVEQYRGDLQMHSEWSDGAPTVEEIAEACVERGYQYAAVTDHSYGLRIAGGMSMAEAAAQRLAIDGVNARYGGRFRILQGVEANIDAAGQLDLTDEEAATFEVVLAAPHSKLRKNDDQTDRMLTRFSTRRFGFSRTRAAGSPARARASSRTGRRCSKPPPSVVSRSRSTGIPRGRTWISRWDGRPYRSAVSLRSTATHTPPDSCPMRRPHWRTHGWPPFPRQNRQLLAAGAAPGLVGGSVLRVSSLNAALARRRSCHSRAKRNDESSPSSWSRGRSQTTPTRNGTARPGGRSCPSALARRAEPRQEKQRRHGNHERPKSGDAPADNLRVPLADLARQP